MKRFFGAAACAVVAVATIGLAATPAGAAPLVSVTPNTALVDGQNVSVAATGYTPGSSLAVIECVVGATSESDCDTSTLVFAQADGSGALSTTYGVFRQVFTVNNTSGIDCAPANCTLVVANIVDQSEAASSPLNFDASVPLPPTLQVTAAINSTGSFTKAGSVVITGTVTCNMLADVALDISATQRAGRVLLHAEGFDEVPCNGPTPYSVTLASSDGIFRGGSATVTLNFISLTGRRDIFGTANRSVQLRGKAQ